MPNPTAQPGQLVLRLTTDAAVEGAATVELSLPFNQQWLSAWQGVAGVEPQQQGARLIVRARVRDITLPAVTFAAGALLESGFTCTATGSLVPR